MNETRGSEPRQNRADKEIHRAHARRTVASLAPRWARLYHRFVPTDPAWQAFHEARELFHAGRLACQATGKPFNGVPLIKRSLLLLLQSLAASEGVLSTDRDEIVAAALRVEEREWVLRLPITRELERLDELDRRFPVVGAHATEEEAKDIERLIETIPGALASARRYLGRRGVPSAVRERRRNRRRVVAVVSSIAVLLGGAVFLRNVARSAREIAYGGVHGVYFSDVTFTQVALSRRDTRIDFNWGSGSPGEPVPADNFSVRWFGKLQVPAADTYAFYLASDDGARLYIDDKLVVDNWGDHGLVEANASVELPAGPVTVRLEYFDHLGNAVVRLFWSSRRIEKQIISGEAFIR